jgi:hypothetical protein
MTDDQSNKAIEAVRKHFRSMLEKLETMKAEQEEDLLSASGTDKIMTEAALDKTKKLIDEINRSQVNIEMVLKSKGL